MRYVECNCSVGAASVAPLLVIGSDSMTYAKIKVPPLPDKTSSKHQMAATQLGATGTRRGEYQTTRIAHVTPYFWPVIGGITSYVDALVEAQRKLGAQVRVFARSGSAATGVAVGPRKPLAFSMWAARQINQWHPDVVHAHGEWSALAASQLPWGSIARTTVFTVHTNFRPARNGIRELLLGFLLRRASVVTALSDSSAHTLAARFPRLRKIIVCPPGARKLGGSVNLTRSIPRDLNVEGAYPVICAVSMMVWPEKVRGLQLLIRSMPQVARTFPSARLIIVGDGFLRGEVENEIDAAKARDLVVLVGKREDPGPFISISDIFAHISLRDTFGQVLLEALSLGKPVFVNEETAYNLPPEIRDGAIMVVGTTVPEIAQGLTTISSDVGLRSRLAQKGQSIVTAAYEWDNIARRMMKIYGIPTDGISASSGL